MTEDHQGNSAGNLDNDILTGIEDSLVIFGEKEPEKNETRFILS